MEKAVTEAVAVVAATAGETVVPAVGFASKETSAVARALAGLPRAEGAARGAARAPSEEECEEGDEECDLDRDFPVIMAQVLDGQAVPPTVRVATPPPSTAARVLEQRDECEDGDEECNLDRDFPAVMAELGF